jgi:transposase, IS30 family
MTYKHLTQLERYQIAFFRVWLKLGIREIARRLNRSPSTISRELWRNADQEGYEPSRASRRCLARMRARQRCRRITGSIWQRIERLLARDFSPEQAKDWLEQAGHRAPSVWRIYQYIRALLRAGRALKWRFRRPKRRYGYARRHAPIANRVPIEQRPAIVESRERFGDWEIDLMFGVGQSCALVTLVERATRYVLMAWVSSKSAAQVTQAIVNLLNRKKLPVHTITTDNGTEFTYHETIAKALNAKFFFAHPYASWERGAIENTNGLIRHYFPKGMDFKLITKEAISFATRRLNHRPRKCLGFRTPHQVLKAHLQSQTTPVALIG